MSPQIGYFSHLRWGPASTWRRSAVLLLRVLARDEEESNFQLGDLDEGQLEQLTKPSGGRAIRLRLGTRHFCSPDHRHLDGTCEIVGRRVRILPQPVRLHTFLSESNPAPYRTSEERSLSSPQ